MTILSLMFFCGIIAFLIGVVILLLKGFAELFMGMASAVARTKLDRESVGDKLVAGFAWLLLIGGVLFVVFSAVACVAKWLGLV